MSIGIGATIGSYRISKRLGGGAMGTVFLAHDPQGREVARKVIHLDGDSEFVKILDFGLAKLVMGGSGALQHKTATGSVLGTPHYMAPEQCEGKEVDHRVDVYALGCIMYQMLTGRVPFTGEGFGEVLIKHLREPPQMPSKINPKVTPAVEKIIL